MRGGLGRTLLTAFLILTILPLTLIGAYAIRQNRRNLEVEVGTRLLAVAVLKGELFLRWLEELEVFLTSSLLLDGGQGNTNYALWWETLHHQMPDLSSAVLLDKDGDVIWAVQSVPGTRCQDIARELSPSPARADSISSRPNFDIHAAASIATVTIVAPQETAVLCFSQHVIEQMLSADVGVGETGRISLVQAAKISRGEDAGSYAISDTGAVTDDEGVRWLDRLSKPGYELYQNQAGDVVVGAYYPLPGYDVGVLVEQDRAEVDASTERITATLIAAILAVALGTTAIAAVVIRQITRPVIDLTESAVAMAEGDLDQSLAVRSRDEIGILTYVFNEMAADLKSLYSDLEAKVVERTQKLQRANYQIQRRALQLQASQDVSQVITSIRDPDHLLSRVTDLILNHFVYTSVAVYLVAPGGGEARLQAYSPRPQAIDGDDGARCPWPNCYRAGDGSVVGRAVRQGEAQVHAERTEDGSEWARMVNHVAVPLTMAHKIVGVIAVRSMTHEVVQEDELEVLEILANQITIALENARAYERERLAMEQLEAAEAFKSRFLANMSRELREPLNTIIGFSRLLIKELDGPINDRQREDLEQIHNDSQNLLFRINDILSISQIQAGLMELRLQPVDLHEMVVGIMPTAGALVRGRDIDLVQEIPEDLPMLYGDPSRLRQVLVHLFNNAAKFTREGAIAIRAWVSDGEVFVSVSDTGIGIPVEDRERIFKHFEKGKGSGRRNVQGVGLGLALSKEFVELHGGQMWVDSEVGEGSVFTFSVPIYVVEG
jgi:signal transduction histidine kinase